MSKDTDFDDLIPMRTDGKINELPRIDRPLKNVEPLSATLQHLRDEGIKIDAELEKRGLDKNGRPKR